MKYLIDANIFLRLLTHDNQQQAQECGMLIKAIRDNKINACTTSLTITEVVWTLQSFYTYKKDAIIEAIKGIHGVNALEIIDGYDNEVTIKLFERHSIKFVDCVLASIPEIQNKEWGIISYDTEFDKLGIIRKEPGELVKKMLH